MAPVLLICFDRREKTAQALARLQNWAGRLYLFQDGNPPKGAEGIKDLFAECKKNRPEGSTVVWCPDQNLGPRDGPWTAIRWMLKAEGAGIILEEDIVPEPEFLEVYSAGLERFAAVKEVFALGSCPKRPVPPVGDKLWAQTRLLLVWGWATWWDRIEPVQISPTPWRDHKKKILKNIQTWAGRLYLEREFDMLAANPHYCWSYYAHQHMLMADKVALCPRAKLTMNTGVGTEARRTKKTPDTKPDRETAKACLDAPQERAGYSKRFQAKMEKEKFTGLLHELRNRLALRARLSAWRGGGR